MLSIGAFNALLKDTGRTAILRDLYSGNHRSSQNSDHDFVPLPEIRFSQNFTIETISRPTAWTCCSRKSVEAEEKAVRYVAKAGRRFHARRTKSAGSVYRFLSGENH